jgi:choline-sulfatase
MTDQQFADAMSCTMGDGYIKTPNMDRLAASGMRFTKAYCANPLCVPNRTSIFTGRYPHEHGKQTNSTRAIDPEEFPNIGMVLRKAGYATGYFGKWHLPYPFKKSTPETSGYDRTLAEQEQAVLCRFLFDESAQHLPVRQEPAFARW